MISEALRQIAIEAAFVRTESRLLPDHDAVKVLREALVTIQALAEAGEATVRVAGERGGKHDA